ncbi:MAG: aldo/keto reductase [Bacteroidota bacterium]
MNTIKIGTTDNINRMGFGTMRLTTGPGIWGDPADRQHAIHIIREAVELGVNFVDTADAYGPGNSELLVAEALAPFGEEVLLATKGGAVKYAPASVMSNGHPYYLQKAVEASLRRLKRSSIDLYFLHRVDPNIPIEDSVGALAAMQKAGKIKQLGLSNVTVEQLQIAQRVAPIAAVQNAFSITDRRYEALVNYTKEQGIAFVAHTPVGKGQLPADFAQANWTASQTALAWLLQFADHIIAIPGTSQSVHLQENMAALALADQGPVPSA